MNLRNNILFILSFVSIVGSLGTYAQLAQKKIAVTHVVGMTYKEAKDVLQNKGSEVGAITHNPGVENFDSLIVFKQYPPAKNDKGVQNFIRNGQSVDLWIAGQTTLNDTLKTPVHKKSYRLVSHKMKS